MNVVRPLVTPALVAAGAQLVAGDAAGAGLALQHQPQVTTTAATAATPPPLHQPPQVPTQLANYRACAGITTEQEAAGQENGEGRYLLELSTVLREILQCPEKDPTMACSKFEVSSSSFRIKNIFRHFKHVKST